MAEMTLEQQRAIALANARLRLQEQGDTAATAGQEAQSAEPSIGDRAARVAGLGARGVVRGVTAIPTMMAEAVAAPLRALTGGKYFPSPAATLERTMTQAGLPEPATPTERLSTGAVGAMSGVGSQLGALSGLRPTSGAGEAIRQTLLQQPARQVTAAATGATGAGLAAEAGAGPLGQFAAGMAGGMLPFAPQMLRGQPSPEAMRTAQTARAARDIGLRLPPTQAKGGITNAVLEGSVAGKAATDRTLSVKNQPAINAAVKRALGIPQSQSASVGALKAIRERAGNDYEAIKSIRNFSVDDEFSGQIGKLISDESIIAAQAPEFGNTTLIKQANSLVRNDFSGETIIALTSRLRESAKAAFKSGDTSAGRFYRGASDALEDLVERNLAKTGKSDLLPKWRTARQTIAKAHTAESALNDQTGNFDARILAAQVDRGAPISGPMRTIGEAANVFGPAMRLPENIGAPATRNVLDYYLSGLGGAGGYIATQNPGWMALAAMPLVRPAVREMITSRPYQALMATPQINPLSRPDATALGILSGAYGNR